jgi:Family of unknown function (DUF5522)/Oxidoreductase-like protein, N-terminal
VEKDAGEDSRIDYRVVTGRVVFTAYYLLRRGECCGSGCTNCPYDATGRPREEFRTRFPELFDAQEPLEQ